MSTILEHLSLSLLAPFLINFIEAKSVDLLRGKIFSGREAKILKQNNHSCNKKKELIKRSRDLTN